MKFSAMLVFTILWTSVVYFPLAHMVWGKGGFLNAALGGTIPALDFAGGTVVHITSGVSALVCALVIGSRVGYGRRADGAAQPRAEPHRRVHAVGRLVRLQRRQRARRPGSLATSAFVATHFAAAAATLGWVVAEWMRTGKPTVLGAISGAVAGLVGITPASGFVTPMAALAIGFVAGLVCFLAVTELKKRLGYDDSLDAFGVHGVGGTLGRAPDRRLRHQRRQPHLQGRRRESRSPSGCSTATARSCSTSSSASASRSASRASPRSSS